MEGVGVGWWVMDRYCLTVCVRACFDACVDVSISRELTVRVRILVLFSLLLFVFFIFATDHCSFVPVYFCDAVDVPQVRQYHKYYGPLYLATQYCVGATRRRARG